MDKPCIRIYILGTRFLTMYLDRNDKYRDHTLQDEDLLENRANTPGMEKGSLHSNDTVH